MDYYPESRASSTDSGSPTSTQSGTYSFAVRLAEYWSRGLPEDQAVRANDIKNDFFGDIRLIRNDFVHNKGEANESTDLRTLHWKFKAGKQMVIGFEMMIDLMDKFPRAELLTPPPPKTPGKKPKRVNMPGSGETELVERFLATVKAKQFKQGKAIDEMLRDWLAKQKV